MNSATQAHSTPGIGPEAMQLLGHVIAGENGIWRLDVDGSELLADLAVSCLLRPAVGDRVLALVTADQAWILAVLEREQAGASELTFPGDVDLTCNGQLRLAGRAGVALDSDTQVAIKTPRLHLLSRLLEGVVGRLSFNAHSADASFDSLKLAGRLFDTVVERFSRRSVNSYRETTELDQTRAAQLDLRAGQNLSLRGRNILAKSGEVTRIDGEQIHLG